MHDLTIFSSLVGGALIGLSASVFMLTHGRVAGISGIFAGALRGGTADRLDRVLFLVGLVVAGVAMRLLRPESFASAWTPALPLALVAGFVVGVGTQLANGCTSGHGVCGISRLSPRSIVATSTFMLTGFVTVFLARHVFGGGQ